MGIPGPGIRGRTWLDHALHTWLRGDPVSLLPLFQFLPRLPHWTQGAREHVTRKEAGKSETCLNVTKGRTPGAQACPGTLPSEARGPRSQIGEGGSFIKQQVPKMAKAHP